MNNNDKQASINDYRQDAIEFGIHSKLNDEINFGLTQQLQNKLSIMQNVMSDLTDNWKDSDTGNNVINAIDSRIWFSNNVYMLFSIGKIFDNFDSDFIKSAISYFDKDTQTVYLGCKYKVLDYKHDTIKRIEQKINVENGNYHLLCVIIVYADNKELINAPEELFAAKGIVSYCFDHDEIKDLLLTFLDRYGLIVDKPIEHIVPVNLSERRDGITHKEIKFKYTDDVDWNSEPNRSLFSDLQYRNDRDEQFAIRTRVVEDQRIFPRDRKSKYRNQNPLYQRIHDDVAGNAPDFHKVVGVNSKMVEHIIPTEQMIEEQKMLNAYELYNNYEENKESKNKHTLLSDYGVDEEMQLPTGNYPHSIRKQGRMIKS